MIDFIKRERGIIFLLAVQSAFIILLFPSTRGAWPGDDSITYVGQGIELFLGGFPSNPCRPVFYPFLLSLAMKLLGFKPFLILFLQALFIIPTTALTYRLALKTMGRRAALASASILVFFPDFLFFFFKFYREAMAAFLFILSLNLVHLMLLRPDEKVKAFIAGVAAGLLCLLKPEFSSMFALLAVVGGVKAVKARDLKTHAFPWILCGAAALLTVFPAITAARAHFGEWIFINTYKGYNYSVSYCGDYESPGGLPSIREFQNSDSRRYDQYNEFARNVMFLSSPEIPYGDRDSLLMDKALECIGENPKKAALMYANRFLAGLFRIDNAAPSWITRGDFGHSWSPAAVQSIGALNLFLDYFIILALGPGMIALFKKRGAWPMACSIIWFLFFYATVFYLGRFRMAVLPAFAIIAAAGVSSLPERLKSRGPQIALAVYIICVLLLFSAVSPFFKRGIFKASSWKNVEIGQGPPSSEKRLFLIIAAEGYRKAGTWDLMHHELGRFIRERKDSLSADDLIFAGDRFMDAPMPGAASFFYASASSLYGSSKAAELLDKLESTRVRDALSSFELAENVEGEGISIYRSKLAKPMLFVWSVEVPLTTKVLFNERPFVFNPAMSEGDGLAPFQYYSRERTIWITLPAGSEAPSPGNPLIVDYFPEQEEGREK